MNCLNMGTIAEMIDPDPKITGPRVRMARAYSRLNRAEFAEELTKRVELPKAEEITPWKLDGFEGKQDSAGRRPATWGELAVIADIAGLPRAFFTADFDRLEEIPRPGVPTLPSREKTEAAAEATEIAKRAARRRRGTQ